MTTTQLFFALTALFIAQGAVLMFFFDRKINPIREQLDWLLEYLKGRAK